MAPTPDSPSDLIYRTAHDMVLSRRWKAPGAFESPVVSTTLSEIATTTSLLRREAQPTYIGGQGAIPPSKISNPAIFAVFALVGVGMVVGSIWFFFWAKNGGFEWHENDWEDYKSTVLRRKGPDGKTLSNATRSTKLGGGTIAGTQRYAWQKQMARSVVGRDEKGRKGILGKRGWGGSHSAWGDDNDYMTMTYGTRTVVTADEMAELRPEDIENPKEHSKRYRDRDVRDYKKERPARVGGINRVADGSHFDYTNSERSDIMSETVISDSSSQPMLERSAEDKHRREQERAERRARDEVAKMERRWKKEAEEAAAMLARENQRPAPAHTKKSSAPSATIRPVVGSQKQQQQRPRSRSPSPRKRDFSYTGGPESEVLSTAYTASTSNRSSNYYDEYLAHRTEGSRYQPSERRQSSPRKKQGSGRPGGGGGYRRGGHDSDLD